MGQNMFTLKAVGTVLGLGRAKQIYCNHTYVLKGYNLVHLVCDFEYQLSYEHILAIFLYTDLYVYVFIPLNFLVRKNMGGGGGNNGHDSISRT